MILISAIASLFVLSGCNEKKSAENSNTHETKVEQVKSKVPITKIEKNDSEIVVSNKDKKVVVKETIVEVKTTDKESKSAVTVSDETVLTEEIHKTTPPTPPTKATPPTPPTLPTPPTPPTPPKVENNISIPPSVVLPITLETDSEENKTTK